MFWCLFGMFWCLFGGFNFLTTKDWRKNFLSTVTFLSSLLIKFTKSKHIYHTLAPSSTTSSIIAMHCREINSWLLKTNHFLNYNSMFCYFSHPQNFFYSIIVKIFSWHGNNVKEMITCQKYNSVPFPSPSCGKLFPLHLEFGRSPWTRSEDDPF